MNLVPRILVPEPAVYLPIYGPSLYNVFKIQILPPAGPIKPVQAEEVSMLSSPLRTTSKLELPFTDNQIEPLEPMRIEPSQNFTNSNKRELTSETHITSLDMFDEEFDILRKGE